MWAPFENTKEYRYGKAGETAIAKWLRSRGNAVLPVYEKIMDYGKGPTLFIEDYTLIAPDLLSMNLENGRICWIEAKHKSGFSWHRINQIWETGIDLRHYSHYLEIAERLPYPLFLFFLQDGKPTKDCPFDESPSGLFGGEIKQLKLKESHRSDKHGTTGMVYWTINTLDKLAEYEELINL